MTFGEILLSIIVSTLTGVATSYFVWWLTFKYWVPRIKFSDFISKTPTNENASGYRYRIKFENSGKRNVIDVEVLIRLRIKGIRSGLPSNWEVVYLPTSSLEYKRVAIVRPVAEEGLRPVLEIKAYECDFFHKAFFPPAIQTRSAAGTLTLDDILQLGTDAEFQILVLGYDDYSGARKFFESKKYRSADIKDGFYDINSLNLPK